MTIEYLDKQVGWRGLEKGETPFVDHFNKDEGSIYSVFATLCDEDMLMIYLGFVGIRVPDPSDVDNHSVALLYKKEVESNFYTKGKFRHVELNNSQNAFLKRTT